MSYIKDQFKKLGKVDKHGLHVKLNTSNGDTHYMTISKQDVDELFECIKKILKDS
jgi:hypothetical protein